MADNIAVTPGTGATVAADDISGVLYQRVKVSIGADGSASDLSSSNQMPVLPSMGSGGHLSLQTNATGTTYTAFGSQVCKQLTVSNQTGTTLEFRQGATGVAFQIPTGTFYTFFGLTNANQIDGRRVDTSNTQVTLTARWES
jgi:hypothetical protein